MAAISQNRQTRVNSIQGQPAEESSSLPQGRSFGPYFLVLAAKRSLVSTALALPVPDEPGREEFGRPTKRRENLLNLVILLPVYNDWECAAILVRKLDSVLPNGDFRAQVIFLDDCSSSPLPRDWVKDELKNLFSVESVRLRRNLGHQRAIAIGLSFIHRERPCDAVLVMDADGQDRPEDVPRLIQKFRDAGERKVIFAERIRRSENWIFRLCYHFYRFLHRLLTGISVRVGNFSIVPSAQLASLVVVSETWNHYAASVLKARLPHDTLPTERGERLAGQSQLNFVALVIHGLSAISVFAETVGVRVTLAIFALLSAILALLSTVVCIRFGTDLAIPGWATTAVGILLVIALQMLTIASGLTFTVLFNRNNLSFPPIRDYQYFVGDVEKVYERKR